MEWLSHEALMLHPTVVGHGVSAEIAKKGGVLIRRGVSADWALIDKDSAFCARRSSNWSLVLPRSLQRKKERTTAKPGETRKVKHRPKILDANGFKKGCFNREAQLMSGMALVLAAKSNFILRQSRISFKQ